MVTLLQKDALVDLSDFKTKGQETFENDEQVAITDVDERSNTFGFFQVRSYYHKASNTRLVYYCITRIWSPYMEHIFETDFKTHKPDLIIANSMLYDISHHHYGKNGPDDYITNIESFFKICSYYTIPVIWRSSLPIGKNAKGGFMQPTKDFQTNTGHVEQVRGDIPIQNENVKNYCLQNRLEFLDVHDHFATVLEERETDGIHWSPFAHRLLNYMTLTFIRRAVYNVPRLPWTFEPSIMKDLSVIEITQKVISDPEKYRDFQGESYFQTASIRLSDAITEDEDENSTTDQKTTNRELADGLLPVCTRKSEVLNSIVNEFPLEIRRVKK